jgi:hypothetical protein
MGKGREKKEENYLRDVLLRLTALGMTPSYAYINHQSITRDTPLIKLYLVP